MKSNTYFLNALRNVLGLGPLPNTTDEKTKFTDTSNVYQQYITEDFEQEYLPTDLGPKDGKQNL